MHRIALVPDCFHRASLQFALSILTYFTLTRVFICFVISLHREAISLVCEAVPGAKGALRKRKVEREKREMLCEERMCGNMLK